MRYALRRLGFFVLTLWVALTLNFLLPRLMPGNPALAMMTKFHDQGANPQTLKTLETLFGVNSQQSLIAQYFGYLQHMLAGAWRLDLDGKPAGVITKAEEEHAKAILQSKKQRKNSPNATSGEMKPKSGDSLAGLQAAARARKAAAT